MKKICLFTLCVRALLVINISPIQAAIQLPSRVLAVDDGGSFNRSTALYDVYSTNSTDVITADLKPRLQAAYIAGKRLYLVGDLTLGDAEIVLNTSLTKFSTASALVKEHIPGYRSLLHSQRIL